MNRPSRNQRGFTLIELMAVVILIGIIATASVVVFSSGGSKNSFHSEIEKFIEYSHQVSDFSILTGEPVGLVVTPPAWAENPIETPGWTYTWRRYVETPPAPLVPPTADAEGVGAVDQSVPLEGEALQEYFQQLTATGEWLDIDGITPVSIEVDVQLFIRLEGNEWEWKNTPKHENPIFTLYPTGEAEPFLFEIEFAHTDLNLESQHVKLDETGRLQWTEAREALLALEERYQ